MAAKTERERRMTEVVGDSWFSHTPITGRAQHTEKVFATTPNCSRQNFVIQLPRHDMFVVANLLVKILANYCITIRPKVSLSVC